MNKIFNGHKRRTSKWQGSFHMNKILSHHCKTELSLLVSLRLKSFWCNAILFTTGCISIPQISAYTLYHISLQYYTKRYSRYLLYNSECWPVLMDSIYMYILFVNAQFLYINFKCISKLTVQWTFFRCQNKTILVCLFSTKWVRFLANLVAWKSHQVNFFLS